MNFPARLRWLTFVVAVSIAPSGCAHIAVSGNVQLTPAGPAKVTRGAPGRWKYTADLTAEWGDGGTTLLATARRRRTCTVIRTAPFEERRVVTRQNTTPRVTALAIGLGLASAVVAGVGVSRYLNGQSLCSHSTDNSCEFNANGNMVLWGSVGVAFLLTTGIYDVFASTDSSDNLGIVNHSEKTEEDCGDEPAARTAVAVRAGDDAVAEGLTDDQGRAKLLVPASAPDRPRLDVFIDGARANTSPMLAIALDEAGHARAANAVVTDKSAPAGAVPARIATPTVVPRADSASGAGSAPTILPARDGDAWAMAGVALRGVTRESLQPQLEQAGARPEPDARRPHVARFDLAALKLPLLNTLEILFDKDERFVGAKFSGPSGAQDEDRLRNLIEKSCGLPQEFAPGKGRWTWKLGSDMDMTLTSGSGGAVSLVVRDLAAAHTAKARSTSRRAGAAPF